MVNHIFGPDLVLRTNLAITRLKLHPWNLVGGTFWTIGTSSLLSAYHHGGDNFKVGCD